MAVATADEHPARAWTAALPFLVAAAVYLVVLAVGRSLLNDPDTYWHIVTGDWIVAHGFPTGDPFSFTFAGAPWIAKEWLSQLAFAGAYHLGGWSLVAVLAAAALALAFALLARFLMAELAPLPVVAFVAVAFVLVAPHAVARPHVLAMPVMVAWVGVLVRAVDRDRPPSYLALALMVLWANLHAEFTLGIVLAVAAGLDAVVEAKPGERARLARHWIAFCLLTLVAASLTPYGPRPMLATYQVLSQRQALSIIGEWQPPDFAHLGTFEIILLAAGGLALYRGFRLAPVRVLVVLGLVHLALSAVRNGELLGLVAPLFLARPLAEQTGLGETSGDAPVISPRRPVKLAVIGAVAVAFLTVGLAVSRDFQPSRRITPAAAVAALQHVDSLRVFNSYDFGGYLIFVGIPPFIDGRVELYGGAFTARHHRAVTLADVNDFIRLLDEYRITATLLSPATPAVALLDRLPGWRRVYADDVAVVHVRAP